MFGRLFMQCKLSATKWMVSETPSTAWLHCMLFGVRNTFDIFAQFSFDDIFPPWRRNNHFRLNSTHCVFFCLFFSQIGYDEGIVSDKEKQNSKPITICRKTRKSFENGPSEFDHMERGKLPALPVGMQNELMELHFLCVMWFRFVKKYNQN